VIPSAYTSVRASTGTFSSPICSGEAYCGDPRKAADQTEAAEPRHRRCLGESGSGLDAFGRSRQSPDLPALVRRELGVSAQKSLGIHDFAAKEAVEEVVERRRHIVGEAWLR
jgi:hypothetical protein